MGNESKANIEYNLVKFLNIKQSEQRIISKNWMDNYKSNIKSVTNKKPEYIDNYEIISKNSKISEVNISIYSYRILVLLYSGGPEISLDDNYRLLNSFYLNKRIGSMDMFISHSNRSIDKNFHFFKFKLNSTYDEVKIQSIFRC